MDIYLELGDIDRFRSISIEFANSGMNDAAGKLARAYRDGIIPTSDSEEALFWFRRAATTKNWWSYDYVELLLHSADKDHLKEAFDFCTSAVKENNGGAMFHLGVMYKEGLYVDKDVDKANYWFKCSSEHGITWASKFIEGINN